MEGLEIRHVYIKSRIPRLNGKMDQSHGTEDRETYQLLNYTDDGDLNEKWTEGENYYSVNRPHGAFPVKTYYEVLLA